jgi:hypothetical protein
MNPKYLKSKPFDIAEVLFKAIPWFIAGTFIVVFTIFFVHVAIMLYVGTAVVSDPMGTASWLGGLVKQFLDAVKQ